MSEEWMQTFLGRDISPFSVDPAKVEIRDIAHALALKTRFTGHTRVHYSVAEHCVRGSELIASGYRLAFLLHELDEVYLPDVPSPIKPSVFLKIKGEMVPWKTIGGRHTTAMLQGLKLRFIGPLIHSATVKEMDLAMLAWEKRDLMSPEPKPWGLVVPPPLGVGVLRPWGWERAEQEFLTRYGRLAMVFDDSKIPEVEPEGEK